MAGRGRRYGQGSFWGDQIGPNPTDRGKNGLKRSLLVEADGGPLAAVIAGANVPDFKLLEATLDAMVVESVPNPPRRLLNICAWNKGYDKQPAREVVERHDYQAHIRGTSEKRRRTQRERSVIQLDDG